MGSRVSMVLNAKENNIWFLHNTHDIDVLQHVVQIIGLFQKHGGCIL